MAFTKTKQKTVDRGFEKVYLLRGGFEEWKKWAIQSEKVSNKRRSPNNQLTNSIIREDNQL
jgi:3-mercaptopyruvate sulfurtransferase SseA